MDSPFIVSQLNPGHYRRHGSGSPVHGGRSPERRSRSSADTPAGVRCTGPTIREIPDRVWVRELGRNHATSGTPVLPSPPQVCDPAHTIEPSPRQ
jgi:hypothetical protein